MSISRRSASALALAVLMPVLAACGGDDGGGVDDYRSQLGDICADTNKRTARIQAPTGRRPEPATVKRYLEQLAAASKAQNERISRLDPPSDLRGAHDKVLEAAEETADLFDRTARKIEVGASAGELAKATQPLQGEGKALGDRTKAALKDLGVARCAGA